jgi:23S rRNA (guanosine2251-2'-O)-methyltransferase
METEPSVIFGINAILEKLKAQPSDVFQILLSGGAAARVIQSEAARVGIAVTFAKTAVLDNLAQGQRHQGVVARVAAYRYAALDELLDSSVSSLPKRVLILDSITDPGNFGALLRCAEAAEAPHVVISKDRSASVTAIVVKASAGAVHHVKIYRVSNLRAAMGRLKQNGFWLFGLDAAAATSIYDLKYPEKLGIVLGAEGHGMRPLVRQQCDFLVGIPMLGEVTSLNVAVAGGIFLYETLRQTRYIHKQRR